MVGVKRIAFLVCALAVLSIGIAPPGNAHPRGIRDPFQPVVVPGAAVAGAPETATAEGAAVQPETAPATTSEGLAATGGDPRSWVLIAYVLIAIGAGGVAIAKNAQPVRLQSPTREREISG